MEKPAGDGDRGLALLPGEGGGSLGGDPSKKICSRGTTTPEEEGENIEPAGNNRRQIQTDEAKLLCLPVENHSSHGKGWKAIAELSGGDCRKVA